ncbi:PRC-barrel domain-containing protein [Streptomyces sp. NRRL F-4428]|uniref:PRC-barrel domain-containing protein n=1 Tax=Streptomyces sp. NRRL F-4428 TaxID=1609137 RepID=UPI000696BAFB|nr:PRC-barrel domain-containing protein [Streptomyces sp. NRRL F-4428]
MRLADLMGARVLDATGRDIGHVSDVRLTETTAPAVTRPRLRIEGLVIATRRRGRLLAYDHRPVDGPWPLTALARRTTRHALWTPWTAVTAHRPPDRLGEPGTITLDQPATALTPLLDMHTHWNNPT